MDRTVRPSIWTAPSIVSDLRIRLSIRFGGHTLPHLPTLIKVAICSFSAKNVNKIVSFNLEFEVSLYVGFKEYSEQYPMSFSHNLISYIT